MVNYGQTGEIPWWYRIHEVAKTYGISPVEAENLPLFWIKACEEAESANNYAKATIARRGW